MENGSLDVRVETEAARLEGRLDHAVPGVKVVAIQTEGLHRAIAGRGVPGVGEEHSANVKKECGSFFHRIFLLGDNRGTKEPRPVRQPSGASSDVIALIRLIETPPPRLDRSGRKAVLPRLVLDDHASRAPRSIITCRRRIDSRDRSNCPVDGQSENGFDACVAGVLFMSTAIAIEGVTKRFGGLVAVDDLDLRVPRGSLYGFIGPNGSGKSTTLRMIMHIILPDRGRIEVLGQSDTRAAHDRVSYLPEERGLYKRMSVRRLLRYFGALKGARQPELDRSIDHWLERMGLSAWLDKRVDALSKGMAQKVQFISSVLSRPELLILDEPFTGLDPVNAEVLKDAVLDLRRVGRRSSSRRTTCRSPSGCATASS